MVVEVVVPGTEGVGGGVCTPRTTPSCTPPHPTLSHWAPRVGVIYAQHELLSELLMWLTGLYSVPMWLPETSK